MEKQSSHFGLIKKYELLSFKITCTEKALKTEECGEEDVIDDSELVENKLGVNKLLPKHIKEYDNSMEYEIKKKGLDYIENKEMWNVEFFKNKTLKQLDHYKYNWGNFCQLSYHDQLVNIYFLPSKLYGS